MLDSLLGRAQFWLQGFPNRRRPWLLAREELSRVLARATNGAGQVDSSALDWNARLVTALRLRGKKIWGTDG